MRTPSGRDLGHNAFAIAQLTRLVRSLAERSPDELSDMVAGNPELAREWMAELRGHRERLEAEILQLDTALHRLLGARHRASRSAA